MGWSRADQSPSPLGQEMTQIQNSIRSDRPKSATSPGHVHDLNSSEMPNSQTLNCAESETQLDQTIISNYNQIFPNSFTYTSEQCKLQENSY